MAGEKAEWPEHWRWYRNDEGPYLAHLCADDRITIPQLRTMLAFHGLHIVTEAEREQMVQDKLDAIVTRAERKVLEACADMRKERLEEARGGDWGHVAGRELARRGGTRG